MAKIRAYSLPNAREWGNMERLLMDELVAWKNSPRRKPLILNGARQVGKTWLLQEFGRRHFERVAYVNLDNNPAMRAQFDDGYDVSRILRMVQAETGERVVPGETLVIFDEIQECPKALTSLKYFCEDLPELAVAAAGSLLGISMHEGTGYPVGKVDTLDLYPLSFREFLDATGNAHLRQIVDEGDAEFIGALRTKFEPLLRQYYFVGGMPEVVASFLSAGDFAEARNVQRSILQGYERDISKHLSAAETEHALAVWGSIPAHLAQENKKFVFGHIKEGARARDYRAAITWLAQAGVAVRVARVSKPGIPLSAYADGSAFKLFVLDVGLLGAIADVDAGSIVQGNRVYTEFKGAFTEQYVCQQLVAQGLRPYYWSAENSRGEIDFLVQRAGTIYPIEVKAEENLRAKSLRAFGERHPETRPLRLSLSGFRDEGWMRNVPLWALGSPACWA